MVCAVSWPGRLRCGNRETFVRFWTIPGPGEPGSGSWPGQLYLRGGGTTWMPDEKFLSAVPFVQQLNWAKSIDAQGRPVLTGIKPTAGGTLICPGFSGATNWYTPAYNPDTHLFYFLALEDCGTSFLKPESFAEGRPYYATGVRRSRGTKREKSLVAYNFDTGAFEWRYPQAAKASLPAA